VTVRAGARERVVIPVPFDPDQVWRPKPCHHLGDTINDMPVPGTIEAATEGWNHSSHAGPNVNLAGNHDRTNYFAAVCARHAPAPLSMLLGCAVGGVGAVGGYRSPVPLEGRSTWAASFFGASRQ
jgi:hypothetical protein